jgi:hypothetical protein
MALGYPHSHSFAHVGAGLAALIEPTCLMNGYLLFDWPDRSGRTCPSGLGALIKSAGRSSASVRHFPADLSPVQEARRPHPQKNRLH